MYLIIGIAAAAAASVLLYNHFRESAPEAATLSAQRAQQLAAVVLVLSKAVEGVIDALAMGVRPATASARPSWRPQRLVDNEDWDGEYT